jgi:ribosomal protein L11 methyltransferase
VPYRIDLRDAGDGAFDRLVTLGALDVETVGERGLAALMPDGVSPEQIAGDLGAAVVSVSPAAGRDDGSVWTLSARPVRIGRLRIVPSGANADAGAVRLIDSAVFGTGLHPTTALCLQMLDEILQAGVFVSVLDVGTGSGVLALAALALGVPRVTAIDVDPEAVRVAAVNARINDVQARLALSVGGPESVTGTFPLVLANVFAAPLIEMAPVLVRRVGHHGRLMLSGIPQSVEPDVARAYRRLGMRQADAKTRGGWVALLMQATW